MALLELLGLYKTFNRGSPDEVRALRGIDLSIEPGSFVVVIGTNGSGKSTTLNAVAGSFRVDSGTIRLAGPGLSLQLAGAPRRARRWSAACFRTRWPVLRRRSRSPKTSRLASRRGLTRGLGRAASRRPSRRVYATGSEPLGDGHLEDRLDNPIGSLSGGQRQALTLLMATYRRPELLLLDEHTAAAGPPQRPSR